MTVVFINVLKEQVGLLENGTEAHPVFSTSRWGLGLKNWIGGCNPNEISEAEIVIQLMNQSHS